MLIRVAGYVAQLTKTSPGTKVRVELMSDPVPGLRAIQGEIEYVTEDVVPPKIGQAVLIVIEAIEV